MSLLAKVGVFCAFLAVFAVWTVAIYKLTQRAATALVKQRGYLPITAAIGIVSYVGTFVFVWLLSGFLDLRFVGLLLTGQLLSIVLSSVFWAMLGSPKINWGAYGYWESFQMVLRHPWSKWLDMAIGIIVLLGFPIAAGWVYFTSDVPSVQATLRVFQVTIVALFLLGGIIAVKSALLLLSLPTMNEHARDRFLVVQLGSFISWGLMISMILAFLLKGV